MGKRLFVVERYHLVVNPFFVGAPSSVEVEVIVYSLLVRWSWLVFVSLFGRGGLCLYPSSVEVICGCLATGLPLLCEVVFVCLGGGCIG